MTDVDIRIILKNTLLKNYYECSNSKVVEELELPVAKARIDMAVINGYMHGFEIKSASDTLKRIPSQVEAYTKVFDYLSIVTEEKYRNKLLTMTPKWVGIIICNKDGETTLIRKALINKKKQSFFLAKLLWKDELQLLLANSGVKFNKSDRNWLLCEALAERFTVKEISELVREQLRLRANWKGC